MKELETLFNRSQEIKTEKGLIFTFYPGGGLSTIEHQGVQINSFKGTHFEPGLTNIWLRIKSENTVIPYPLLGNSHAAHVSISKNQLKICIELETLICELSFLSDNKLTWFWALKITNKGTKSVIFDTVYFQDIALASEGLVEAAVYYVNQDIDTTILKKDEQISALCSRQNLPMAEKNPWIMSGSQHKVRGCLTDGSQFFGKRYKATGIPEALYCSEPNFSHIQREFSAQILFSDWKTLAPAQTYVSFFYTTYQPDHQEPSSINDYRLAPIALPPGEEKLRNMFSVEENMFSSNNLFSPHTLTTAELQ
ncbi:MAG: hypothetical protein K8R91_06120, partial [Phycisphaerae bacterium]|nr:hypothetical protein [Phycisphaerae bacterium]